MTRSTQKNLAAHEETWFGNIHGNNLQDAWSNKEVSYDRLVGSSSPPSPTTQSYANRDFPVQCESPRTGYRGKITLTYAQRRAAEACLSFERPKLGVIATTNLCADSFAEALDRAI